jgi:hypothetical protein
LYHPFITNPNCILSPCVNAPLFVTGFPKYESLYSDPYSFSLINLFSPSNTLFAPNHPTPLTHLLLSFINKYSLAIILKLSRIPNAANYSLTLNLDNCFHSNPNAFLAAKYSFLDFTPTTTNQKSYSITPSPTQTKGCIESLH